MSAQPIRPTEAGGARHSASPLVLGMILILVGAVAVLARAVDLDLDALVGEQTWPVLVIVPGLVLLALAAVPAPPDGKGFAIAGSIVTTVGLILLTMAGTGAWEAWAYAWTLLPGAAGLGLAGYGLATRSSEHVGEGVRLVVISGLMFLVGRWYFEAIFTTGEPPIDIGTWWPLAVIAIGVVVAARSLVVDRGDDRGPQGGTTS